MSTPIKLKNNSHKRHALQTLSTKMDCNISLSTSSLSEKHAKIYFFLHFQAPLIFMIIFAVLMYALSHV